MDWPPSSALPSNAKTSWSSSTFQTECQRCREVGYTQMAPSKICSQLWLPPSTWWSWFWLWKCYAWSVCVARTCGCHSGFGYSCQVLTKWHGRGWQRCSAYYPVPNDRSFACRRHFYLQNQENCHNLNNPEMSRREKAVRVTYQAYQGDKNVEDNPREKQFHVF